MKILKGWRYLTLVLVFGVLAGCAGVPVMDKADSEQANLEAAVWKDPQNVEARAKLAQWCAARYLKHRHRPSYTTAISELKEIIRLRPDSHWAHCTLGLLNLQEGNNDIASFESKEAIRLDPGCSVAHAVLAKVYTNETYTDEACYDEERIGLAIKEYKEAIRLDPDNSFSHGNLGYLYRLRGLYDLSVFEYREALRLSGEPEYREDVGLSLMSKGECQGAMDEFREVISFNPNLTNNYCRLAWAYCLLSRYDNSLAELKKYQQLSGKALASDFAMIKYFSQKQSGESDKGRQELSNYTKSFKGNERERYLLQYLLGEKTEAEVIGKARNDCDRTLMYFFIGYDYLVEGDKQKAVEYFQKTLGMKVFGFGAYSGASVILERLGKSNNQ